MSVCAVCGKEGSNRESDPHGQWGYHDYVPKVEEPAPQPKPSEVAAEAVVWALIASVAEENKKTARDYVAGYLRSENSRGVDALANGKVIGSVTRSKPSEKRDVSDMAAFIQYVAEHQPELLTIDYRAKEALLRKLKQRDEVFIDENGVVVPGVGVRMSSGTVKVNPDREARELVRDLLRDGRISLDGIKELTAPKPEPVDRYTQDREASGL